MPRSRIGIHVLAGCACAMGLGALACRDDAPRGAGSAVYVRAASYEEELHLMTARGKTARLRVEQPLVLHAQRRSGPWVAVPAHDLEPGQCSVARLPPQLEAEVAGSVRWLVEPGGHASFNVDLRTDGTRTVVFDAPGVYTLTAESRADCGDPFYGDTLTIVVVE